MSNELQIEAMVEARESELRAEVAKDYSDWTLAQVERYIAGYMEGYRLGLQNGGHDGE